jgi:hypothetical protein
MSLSHIHPMTSLNFKAFFIHSVQSCGFLTKNCLSIVQQEENGAQCHLCLIIILKLTSATSGEAQLQRDTTVQINPNWFLAICSSANDLM